MLKLITILFSLVLTANAYVSIDKTYNTGGVNPLKSQNEFFNLIDETACTNTDCSDIWRFNATTTENLKINKSEFFFNQDIYNDKFKVSKTYSISQFLKDGLKFFKNQKLEIDEPDKLKYNVFQVIRKVEANNQYHDTITKNSNNFSNTSVNKENTSIHLNEDKVFNSYMFGQVETNFGLVSGYIYRNRLVQIKSQQYHIIELEKINFVDNLVNKYNEYCSNPINKMFPFIYEPYNFYYSYLEKVNPSFTNTIDFSSYAYPNSLNKDLIKSGMVAIPCDDELIGDTPSEKYNKIKNLSGIIDPNKLTHYDAWTDYGKQDLIDMADHYFENNGYTLRINQISDKHLLNMGISFLNGIMQDRKIENGIVVKSNHFDVTNHYWKTGKCPTHHNDKYVKSKPSDVYFISSLVTDMPFSENQANFNVTSSLKLGAYSPIPAFPNNNNGVYALTPDNHILTHSINNTNTILINLLGLGAGSKLGTDEAFKMTRSWKQHCSSFGFFSFILLIVLIVVTVVSAGASAGLFTATGTATAGTTTMVGGLFTTVGTAATVVTGTSIAASTVALVAAVGAYTAYQNLWSGVTTSPGTVNTYSYQEKLGVVEKVGGLISGSSIYLNFLNLQDTLNSMDNKSYAINPKEYEEIKNKSIVFTKGKSIKGLKDTQILALNTTSEINYLNALFFSHAQPATLPPHFRYFQYKKVPYDPLNSSTYNWNNGAATKDYLNASLLENDFIYTMSGYQLDGSVPNGHFDLFQTYYIMNKILSTYNVNDISKYEN